MKYDIQTRIFLVKKYYQLGSFTTVKRAFRTKFKNQPAPAITVIKNIISVFEQTGSVAYKTPQIKKTGDKRKAAKFELESMIAEMPNLSIRKAATVLNVSSTLIFNILHDDLHHKS